MNEEAAAEIKKAEIKTKAAAKEDELAVLGFTEPAASKDSLQANSPSPLMRRKLADETRRSKSREGDAFYVTTRAETDTEDNTEGGGKAYAL